MCGDMSVYDVDYKALDLLQQNLSDDFWNHVIVRSPLDPEPPPIRIEDICEFPTGVI